MMPAKGNDHEHQQQNGNEPLAAAAVALGGGGGMFSACKSIDALVYDIKENLKLSPSSAGGKMKSSHHSSNHRRVQPRSRATPYSVPPSSRVPCDSVADPKCQSQLRRWNHQRRRYPSTCMPGSKSGVSDLTVDDPFAMLQELISDGSLIKEAVRRLELGLSPKLAMPMNSKNFYDSDDDELCRTPPGAFHDEEDDDDDGYALEIGEDDAVVAAAASEATAVI
jgi:hypothetical protein